MGNKQKLSVTVNQQWLNFDRISINIVGWNVGLVKHLGVFGWGRDGAVLGRTEHFSWRGSYWNQNLGAPEQHCRGKHDLINDPLKHQSLGSVVAILPSSRSLHRSSERAAPLEKHWGWTFLGIAKCGEKDQPSGFLLCCWNCGSPGFRQARVVDCGWHSQKCHHHWALAGGELTPSQKGNLVIHQQFRHNIVTTTIKVVSGWTYPAEEMVAYRSFKPFFPLLQPLQAGIFCLSFNAFFLAFFAFFSLHFSISSILLIVASLIGRGSTALGSLGNTSCLHQEFSKV